MKQSRASSIRDQVEQAIITGDFAPGQRLDEAMLAERFEVSRTPVREALRQLAATDLVEVIPHRGTFVRELSVRDILSMFEVMAELEGVCARLAARRRTPKQLTLLEEAKDACEATAASGDADEYYYANEQLHLHLYDASGNPFLARMAAGLQSRIKPFRRLQLRVPGRLHSSTAEHAAIISAVRDNDPDEAERLVKEHVSVQGDRFGDFLSALG